MDPEREAAARELFFVYDGSEFYMSRDGRDAEFKSFRVPLETRRRWLTELTNERLATIHEDGGWRSVNFLIHHRCLGHLATVLNTAPAGEPWERAAYLERATEYTDLCATLWERTSAPDATQLSPVDLRAALCRIQDRARTLAEQQLMRGQRNRLTELVEDIQRRLDASAGTATSAPTLWIWDSRNRTATPRMPTFG